MLDKAGNADTHLKLLSGSGSGEIKRVMDCHSGSKQMTGGRPHRTGDKPEMRPGEGDNMSHAR